MPVSYPKPPKPKPPIVKDEWVTSSEASVRFPVKIKGN